MVNGCYQTLLDAVSRSELKTLGEVELSRDEDSVMSLANLASPDGLFTFAGVNSSKSEQLSGKNQHFRSFEIKYPKKHTPEDGAQEKDQNADVRPLSKTTLFSTPKEEDAKRDAYQRVVRLSRPKKGATANKRIGAIATSQAGEENEVVIFDATKASPVTADIIQRIRPAKGMEANDIDIFEIDDGNFNVAYCTDYGVYLSNVVFDFSKRSTVEVSKEPRTIYSLPFPDVFEDRKGRLKIRSLRWLSHNHLLLLCNKPNRSGVELLVLSLYGSHTAGSVSLRKSLPRRVKAAVDMDVCMLDADDSGARQIMIAVAFMDISISVFTMEYHGYAKDSLGKFNSLTTLRDVHPIQMSKVVFAPYHSVWPSDLDEQVKNGTLKSPGPQYVRMASTSWGNTVVVETFSLSPVSAKKPGSRYVAFRPSRDLLNKSAVIVVLSFTVLVTLLFFQAGFDWWYGGKGGNIMPPAIQQIVANLKPPGQVVDEQRQAAFHGTEMPAAAKVSSRLRDVLSHKHKHKSKAIVVRDTPDGEIDLSAEVHDDHETLLKEDTEAKKWEDLSHTEREKWKDKLIRAGGWAVEEGETVLKGIFFSEYAGVVGQMARAAMD